MHRSCLHYLVDGAGEHVPRELIAFTSARPRRDGFIRSLWIELRCATRHKRRVTKTLYEVLGDARLRQLVDRFYDHMDSAPDAAVIRAMHAPDLSEARDKLYWFLVGWSGGPPLYVQRFGHPRLRARHLPFAIGDDEALQWMHCMRLALAEVIAEVPLRATLEATFGQIADHMRNQESDLG